MLHSGEKPILLEDEIVIELSQYNSANSIRREELCLMKEFCKKSNC